MTKGTKSNTNSKDALLALRTLESLLATNNMSKKHIYLQNFLRGMFFSMGTIVGIAVVGTVVLWILSLFDQLPFIQHISDAISNSL